LACATMALRVVNFKNGNTNAADDGNRYRQGLICATIPANQQEEPFW
jgi:hypothetical protein